MVHVHWDLDDCREHESADESRVDPQHSVNVAKVIDLLLANRDHGLIGALHQLSTIRIQHFLVKLCKRRGINFCSRLVFILSHYDKKKIKICNSWFEITEEEKIL